MAVALDRMHTRRLRFVRDRPKSLRPPFPAPDTTLRPHVVLDGERLPQKASPPSLYDPEGRSELREYGMHTARVASCVKS